MNEMIEYFFRDFCSQTGVIFYGMEKITDYPYDVDGVDMDQSRLWYYYNKFDSTIQMDGTSTVYEKALGERNNNVLLDVNFLILTKDRIFLSRFINHLRFFIGDYTTKKEGFGIHHLSSSVELVKNYRFFIPHLYSGNIVFSYNDKYQDKIED